MIAIFEKALDHPRWVLALTAFFSVLSLAQIPKAQIDADVVALFLDDSQRSKNFRDVIDTFGAPEPVVLAWTSDAPLSDESLAKQAQVAKELSAFPDIDRVLALPTLPQLEEGAMLSFVPLSERVADIDESARIGFVQKDPVAQRLLGKDEVSAAMIVFFVTKVPTPLALQFTAEERLTTAIQSAGLATSDKVFVSGIVSTNAVLLRSVLQNLSVLLPATLLLLFLIVFYFYRSLWPVVLAALVSLIAILWATGACIVFDPKFSVMHSITPVLIATLSLADTIFLINAYVRALDETPSPKEAIRLALRRVTPACILTSLLSLTSFGSLLLMPVHLFQVLGLATGIGVFSALILVLTLGPMVLVHYQPQSRSRGQLTKGISTKIARAAHHFTKRFPRLFLALALLTPLLLIPVSTLRYETDIAGRFRADHPVRVSEAFIRQEFGGNVPLEVALTQNQNVLNATLWNRLEDFEKRIRQREEVSATASLPSLLRPYLDALVGQAGTPWNDELIAQILVLSEDAFDLGAFVSTDKRRLRFTVLTNTQGLREQSLFAKEVERLASESLETPLFVTGLAPLLGGWLNTIYDAQRGGLILMILGVIVFLAFGFRSLKSSLVALSPNALPLLLFMASMALMGLRFDSDFLVLLIVGLGLVVDDTIHFVLHFQRQRKEGSDIEAALLHTTEEAGAAMVQTTAILIIGLSPLYFSDYNTVRMFSTELSKIVVFALLADLFVLPALIRARWIT